MQETLTGWQPLEVPDDNIPAHIKITSTRFCYKALQRSMSSEAMRVHRSQFNRAGKIFYCFNDDSESFITTKDLKSVENMFDTVYYLTENNASAKKGLRALKRYARKNMLVNRSTKR